MAWDGEGCEGVGMFSRLYHISNISHPHCVLCPCHFYIECLLALSSHVYCMIILIMFIFSSQISKCDVCQHMNRKMTTGKPELHPIPVKAPWHQIGIDFVGPLSPESDDGSRYIFTASDYFTKWVEAVPTIDKSASTVATVLFKVATCMCSRQTAMTALLAIFL